MTWKNESALYRKWLKSKGTPETFYIAAKFPPFVLERFAAGDGEIHLEKKHKKIYKGIWRAQYGRRN